MNRIEMQLKSARAALEEGERALEFLISVAAADGEITAAEQAEIEFESGRLDEARARIEIYERAYDQAYRGR